MGPKVLQGALWSKKFTHLAWTAKPLIQHLPRAHFSAPEVVKLLRNAFGAPKCVLESQNHRFDLGKHKGWSTWVILERQVVKRSDLGDLARFDRSDPPQTSVKYTPKRICQKVKIFKLL